ncbi:MAG: Rieske 2Fe-2S domain-containing protein [Planctomycetes bacterium]|nr:Rieske 2Fe-2S domain-containing protein [Planctomycetota bacterium]
MADSLPETPPPSPGTVESPGAVAPRRGFLSLLAVIAGSIAGLVPLAAGTIFFLDPILRKRQEVGGGMLQAVNVSDLPTDGTPLRVTLKSDIPDAWTTYRDRVIGSVYLRLMPNGQVLAFNDTCTHLGCKVDYQPAEKRYFCPCHQSAFGLDGARQNKTPPRDLDSLDVEIKDGVIWVKYVNFRTVQAKKEPV